MAIFLAALAVAVVVVLVVLVVRRSAAADGASKPGGRLARRVEEARAADARYVDDYVDEQAAIWSSTNGGSSMGRPALFRDDVGRPDPRTPDAYDVSDLYLSGEALADESADDAAEEALEDLVEDDYGWEYVDEDEEAAADHAFAADLDEVDDDPEFDRFAPRRSMTDAVADEAADEFASELLGLGSDAALDEEETDPAVVGESSGGELQRRTPKTSAESYKQPLRLARTQHRPTGATRRSPDQIRSMLLNYRGGMKKGRESPSPTSDPEAP